MDAWIKGLIAAIIVAVIGFIFWLIQQLITSKSKEHYLEKENSALNQGNSTAKKEIATLQKEISKYTQRDTILSKYIFDEYNGIFIHKESKKACCPYCLGLSTPKETRLKVGRSGWYCAPCNKQISRP